MRRKIRIYLQSPKRIKGAQKKGWEHSMISSEPFWLLDPLKGNFLLPCADLFNAPPKISVLIQQIILLFIF